MCSLISGCIKFQCNMLGVNQNRLQQWNVMLHSHALTAEEMGFCKHILSSSSRFATLFPNKHNANGNWLRWRINWNCFSCSRESESRMNQWRLNMRKIYYREQSASSSQIWKAMLAIESIYLDRWFQMIYLILRENFQGINSANNNIRIPITIHRTFKHDLKTMLISSISRLLIEYKKLKRRN